MMGLFGFKKKLAKARQEKVASAAESPRKKLTCKDLAKTIAQKTSLKRHQIDNVLKSLLDIIGTALPSGGLISLHGLGQFRTKLQSRTAFRNPKTGQVIVAAPKNYICFKASGVLKRKVNRKLEGVTFLKFLDSELSVI